MNPTELHQFTKHLRRLRRKRRLVGDAIVLFMCGGWYLACMLWMLIFDRPLI